MRIIRKPLFDKIWLTNNNNIHLIWQVVSRGNSIKNPWPKIKFQSLNVLRKGFKFEQKWASVGLFRTAKWLNSMAWSMIWAEIQEWFYHQRGTGCRRRGQINMRLNGDYHLNWNKTMDNRMRIPARIYPPLPVNRDAICRFPYLHRGHGLLFWFRKRLPVQKLFFWFPVESFDPPRCLPIGQRMIASFLSERISLPTLKAFPRKSPIAKIGSDLRVVGKWFKLISIEPSAANFSTKTRNLESARFISFPFRLFVLSWLVSSIIGSGLFRLC